MIKSVFFCALNEIKVKEDLGEGICLVPNEKDVSYPRIYITNNKKEKERLFNQATVNAIGYIEYHDILNSELIAYSLGEFPDDEISPIEYLNKYLSMLRVYFFCTWLIKDNSANFDLGFLCYENKRNEFEVSSNFFNYHNYNSDGKSSITEFTKHELLNAAKILFDNTIVGEKVDTTASERRYGKTSTAGHFVQFARVCNDIGLKMTNYCSALETLFSTNNTELSHRLSERISLFIGTNKKERIELYKTLKSSYHIRSKVIHGGSFKNGQIVEMRILIRKMDEICRKVLTSSLSAPENENIFDLNNEELDEFFMKKIME